MGKGAFKKRAPRIYGEETKAEYEDQKTEKVRFVKNNNVVSVKETVIKTNRVIHKKPGKEKKPLCGKKGDNVPNLVWHDISSLDGSGILRVIPQENIKLLYRYWFSSEIINQTKYFKTLFRPNQDELVKVRNQTDLITQTFPQGDGRKFKNFNSVITFEQLKTLVTEVLKEFKVVGLHPMTKTPIEYRFLDVMSKESIVAGLELLKRNINFTNNLHLKGIGKAYINVRHRIPKKDRRNDKKPLKTNTTKIQMDNIGIKMNSNNHKIVSEENGSNGEHTGKDDVKFTFNDVYDTEPEFDNYEIPLKETNHPDVYHMPDGKCIWVSARQVCNHCYNLLFQDLDTSYCYLIDNDINPKCYIHNGDVMDINIPMEVLYLVRGVDDYGGDVLMLYPMQFIMHHGVLLCETQHLHCDEDADLLEWEVFKHNSRFCSLNPTSCSMTALSLNGSNGEFTNKHDVDNAARVRMHKEAETNRYRKGDVGKTKHGKVCKYNPCTNKNCTYQHSETSVVVEEKIILHPEVTKIVNQDLMYSYNGKSVVIRSPVAGNNNYVDQDGIIYESVPQNTIIQNVIRSSYGYVVIQEGKGKPVLASGAIISSTAFSNDVNIRTRRPIFKPLEKVLSSKFSTGLRDQKHAREACLSTASTLFNGLSQELINDTISLYLLNNETQRVQLSYSLSQVRINETLNITSCGVEYSHNSFWRVDGTNVDFDMDWPLRNDVSVLPDQTRGTVKYNNDYLGFVTQDNVKVRHYLTCMFRFQPNHRNRFEIHDVNGHNIKYALKRILGCVDNNEVYQTLQYSNLTCYGVNLTTEEKKDFTNLARIRFDKDDQDEFIIRVGCPRFKHVVNLSPRNLLFNYDLLLQIVYTGIDPRMIPISCLKMQQIHIEVRNNLKTHHLRLLNRLEPSLMQFLVDNLVNTSTWAYYSLYEKYLLYLEPIYSREYSSEIVHVKRALRRKQFNNITVHANSDCLVKKIEVKIKKEFAKTGKVDRLFASYGPGGLYAPELPEILKIAIHGKYYMEGEIVSMTIIICSKLKRNELDVYVQEAIHNMDTPNHLYFFVYSDDGFFIGNYCNKLILCTTDISSCDASNRFPMFFSVYSLLSAIYQEKALGLVEQCTKPLEVVNPSNRDEILTLQVHSCFEGSGTLLTTLINHDANSQIGVSIFTILNKLPGVGFNEACQLGSALVGHKLTIDMFNDIEKLQFLKRSPMLCTNERGEQQYKMCINMSTVLRGLGTMEGDMSHEQLGISNADFLELPWEQRLQDFCSVVIQGLVHEPSNRILLALRQKFNAYNRVIRLETPELLKLKNKHTEILSGYDLNNESWTIEESSFKKRYNLEDFDIDLLVEQIGNIMLGVELPSNACAQMFLVDYQLTIPTI